MVPPLPSNFLQHPWSLGLPIAVTALLIFQTRRIRSVFWWVSLSLLLLVLSYSQIVLFGGTLGAMTLAGALTSPAPRWRNLLAFAVWGVAILLLARELHGFFARTVEPAGLRLDHHPFWKSSILEWGKYLSFSLGFLLFLGGIGFSFLKKERLFVLAISAFGLGVFSLYSYPNSWDIVKFLMLVQFGLALTSAATLWTAWQQRLRVWSLLGLLGVTAYGTGWLLTGAVGAYDGWYTTKPDDLASPADAAMIAYIRKHIGPGEAVFRRDAAWGYAILGGLPIQHVDSFVGSFGFSQKLWDERSALVYKPHPDVDDYKRQGIRWFVFGDWDGHMRTQMDEWLNDGKAEHLLSVPPLDLYRLK
jgi:hypothetical protein